MRWVLLILFVVLLEESYSQIRRDNHARLYPTPPDKYSRMTDVQLQKVQTLFQIIQDGIAKGSVNKFSSHFDNQMFVNITRGESGYFSANQAAALLQHYMSTRKVISFEFSRISEKGVAPYATGRMVSIYKGSLESAQVYVSCSWQSTEWVIGQFNIY